jgi:hypothetical protein
MDLLIIAELLEVLYATKEEIDLFFAIFPFVILLKNTKIHCNYPN